MKALSIWQPWASLIIAGPKRVENRNWGTPWRGPLLIHASKAQGEKPDWQGPIDDIDGQPEFDALPFGALLGIVKLTACVMYDEDKRVRRHSWASGPVCWVMLDPQPFAEPIPYRGQRKLFDVPDDILSCPWCEDDPAEQPCACTPAGARSAADSHRNQPQKPRGQVHARNHRWNPRRENGHH